MARDGSKTGGRDFEKGIGGNPAGIRKGTMTSANDFKDWCFDLFKNNRECFKTAIMQNKETKMQFLKILAGFVPKKPDLDEKDSKPLIIKWL